MTFMMRPRHSAPTGTEIGAPGVDDFLAADQTFGGVHRDGADGVLAEVLGDFENQAVAHVVGLERVQDERQVAAFECNVTTAPMTGSPCRQTLPWLPRVQRTSLRKLP